MATQIWIDSNESIWWDGTGWYASRQEGNKFVSWKVGDDRDAVPDTYTQGLGTPHWYEKRPARCPNREEAR